MRKVLLIRKTFGIHLRFIYVYTSIFNASEMKNLIIFLSICVLMLFDTHIYSGTNKHKVSKAKILSYNVRNCKGLDNITDYKRISAIINRIDAEVVALQELDSVTERSNKVFVLKELAAQTNMFPTYRASISYQGGKYGIGILTKEKPVQTEEIPLPGKEEKRSLLIVELENYVICCTHWSLTSEDRISSVDLINKIAVKYSKPVFLAGDLNAEPGSTEMKNLQQDWLIMNDPEQPTIPANDPKKCIDYILAKKDAKYVFKTITSVVENEPVASDHLPVWAEISFTDR